ncbi:F0F1 ATP synthase subunit epsilon [Parabacteroides sp. 52]|uniref:F0F1 ATP synthase subunit epsilon n=1 Tax=unclassified Parabacteroides TaxID=2649774 RepID=UPI0013D4DEE9|nr:MULTISPECIES: F0F1 ATP synthase subunit epsilon [unclassified Parabacteroides]MDH6535467.1 F-type H+-transporting ATPase subunit epsilon [Parabacteroides sp. PM5-20]NDV55953.1 F0F1 ATP synthase subunit epsilon [Parabacteroides sp. 52]
MELIIITPMGIVCNRQVDKASFPGSLGVFTVFPNHAPIVSTIKKGVVRYNAKGEAVEQEIEVKEGIVEIKQNKIWIFTEQ